MAARGLRTAILDLTQGEAGTRGTADERAREAEEAARILGVGWRQALDLPDGAIENTLENRIAIVRAFCACSAPASSSCPIGRRAIPTTPSLPLSATRPASSPA